jgi:eukaryotic-like serine/threonine-protein kinase
VRKTAIARRTGQYERLELLGEGGVGQVYAARDRLLGRQVAIKTLRPQFGRDRDFLTRFYGEAQRLGELNHPNITTLYALHLEGQEPFMVMELVRGQTLEALLAHVHRLPLREALAVVAQAASGLTYAHRMGIIHRDVKPANLMVSESGLLKIMDFGIARVRGSQRLTRAGQMFGTLLYASPEQICGGDVSERSDRYSLAVGVKKTSPYPNMANQSCKGCIRARGLHPSSCSPSPALRERVPSAARPVRVRRILIPRHSGSC